MHELQCPYPPVRSNVAQVVSEVVEAECSWALDWNCGEFGAFYASKSWTNTGRQPNRWLKCKWPGRISHAMIHFSVLGGKQNANPRKPVGGIAPGDRNTQRDSDQRKERPQKASSSTQYRLEGVTEARRFVYGGKDEGLPYYKW